MYYENLYEPYYKIYIVLLHYVIYHFFMFLRLSLCCLTSTFCQLLPNAPTNRFYFITFELFVFNTKMIFYNSYSFTTQSIIIPCFRQTRFIQCRFHFSTLPCSALYYVKYRFSIIQSFRFQSGCTTFVFNFDKGFDFVYTLL